MENEKTRQLIVKTLSTVEKVVDVNGENNVGICKAADKKTDVYVLGNNVFHSPIEIYSDKKSGHFGVLIYNPMNLLNHSWTLRHADAGYFIHDGKYYTNNDECKENEAIQVPTAQVLRELKKACEWWMDMRHVLPTMKFSPPKKII